MQGRCEYIAPWALANEPFPLHLIWNKGEIVYDKIIVKLPTKFKIVDVFNILNYGVDGSRVTINELLTDGFLGLSLISEKTFEEPLHIEPLSVEFIQNSRVTDEVILQTKIIRPLLKQGECPNMIELTDDLHDADLKKLIVIPIRHEGMGKAKITIRVRTSGSSIINTESLYAEVIKRMLDRYREQNPASIQEEVVEDIQVDPDVVAKYAIDFSQRLKNGEHPTDVDIKHLQEIQQGLEDPIINEQIAKILRSEIERIWISSLLYYLNRHPAHDIELSGGATHAIFQSEMKNLKIEIEYVDSMENRYDPLKIEVKVNDRRKNKDRALAVPINFDWTLLPLEGI